jgi:DNA-binding FadR family transcriptional regulator
MASTQIDRSRVSDQVFALLCEQVLSGRYEPGERLPTQRRLAADLGVNMASVREAVKRLEQLGVVEARHGDGMRVRDWRDHGGLDVIAHVLFRAGGLDRQLLAALLEARRLMLSESARLAAARRTDEQSDRLSDLAASFASAPGAAEAQLLDWAFMSEVVEASGNVVFTLILNSIRRLYLDEADLFRAVVADRPALTPLYRRAARAIRSGSGAGAARAVAELAELQEQALRESLP